PARGAALEGPQEHHPAAARRAAEERAGRPPLRAAGLHDPGERRLSGMQPLSPARDNPLAEYFLDNTGRLIHKWHHYFGIYHRHFERFRGRSPVGLEVGVSPGGSVAVWPLLFL